MTPYTHSHILTAGYLRGWAEDGLVSVGWADGSPVKRLPPKEIGVRTGFYRERHADGTTSDWFEPAMSELEGKALSVIRRAEELWPLGGEDRGLVGQFLALQLTRGPAWRDWYESTALPRAARLVAQQPDRTPSSVNVAETHMKTDRERHDRILANIAPLGTQFINMHWTLLRCGAPRLATSDHPLVPFPMGAPGADVSPIAAVPAHGVLATCEFRFALTPRHLLLLTWLDDRDEAITKMPINLVRNHNAVVMRQADKQWFHHPDCRPEFMAGPYGPLSERVFGLRYQPFKSIRREVVKRTLQEMHDGDGPETSMRLIDWDSTEVRAA